MIITEFMLIMLFLSIPVMIVWAITAWRHRVTAPTLAKSAPKPDLTTRLVETVALLCIGGWVLYFVAHYQGLPGYLDLVDPAIANAWLWAFAISSVGLVLTVLLAALWRTWLAVVLMTACLCAASWVFNAEPQPGFLMAAGIDETPVKIYYTLAPQPDYNGVKLHINGVYLGEAPVTLPMDEFLAKVPYWPEPPDGLTDEHFMHQKDQNFERPWTRFEVSGYVKSLRPFERAEPRHYYAQLELDGEWGTAYVGGGGGGGHGMVNHYPSEMQMKFPMCDKRIKAHIDTARGAGNTINTNWIAQMDQFGPRGWQLLRQKIKQDPKLLDVMNAWATQRYGLGDVDSPDEAWEALTQIMDDAEAQRAYNTASVAGAAVDMLVPLLDPRQLTDAAVNAITKGMAEYNFSKREYGFSTYVRFEPTGSGAQRPTGHYVLAHAVWRMDQRLDAVSEVEPNIIETEVLTALVMKFSYGIGSHDKALEIATAMDWPYLFDFLVRHDWNREMHHRNDNSSMEVGHGGNAFVNVWLYRLLMLESPEGRAFRVKHNYRLQRTADTIVKGEEVAIITTLRFLFLDNELEEQSPAWRYWQHYAELTKKIQPMNGYWGARARFLYLAHMEPLSTLDQYRQALRMTTGKLSWVPYEALDTLPKQRRIEVMEMWIDELKKIAADPSQKVQPWMQQERLIAQPAPGKSAGLIWHLQLNLEQLRKNK